MNITDVRVKKVANKGRLRATVIITIDNAFVVRNIRVIDGKNGLFVAMPSIKMPDGEYRDIAHPINQETRNMLVEKVLNAFNEAPDPEVPQTTEEPQEEKDIKEEE